MHPTPRRLFRIVMQRGTLVHSPHFSLKTRFDDKRFVAVVVSKKTAKTAVMRNTVKRRVRSLVAAAPIPEGFQGIFFAKKGAPSLSFGELKQEIAELIAQAQARKKRL